MIKIAPSILSADFSRLGEEIEKLEKANADLIHIDVMDGRFVPNITIGPPVVKSLRPISKLPFDVHLMIEDPDMYIDSFIDAGADLISVHVEACKHPDSTIQRIKARGKKASVVLNPATSLNTIEQILSEVDMVLLMTVNPGFGGQAFIESSIDKVRDLKEMICRKGLKVDIEVDGGINLSNIHRITEAGANIIVAGNTIFKADDTAGIIRELKEKAFKEGQ